MLLTRPESAVVVVFRNTSDAETAAGELMGNAFAEDHIHITSGNTLPYRGAGHHENSVRNWFESIFGMDDQTERQYYENAVAAGNVLLGLDTPEQNIDAAAKILTHHAPLDVRSYGASAANRDQSQAMPPVPEELRISKRTVLPGGVQVYSHAVQRSAEEGGDRQEGQTEVPCFGPTRDPSRSVTLCHWQPHPDW